MGPAPRDYSLNEPLRWDDLGAFHERALLDDDDSLHDRHRAADELSDVEVIGETPAAIYLRDISRVKLLTAEQEVDFAMAIEQGRLSSQELDGLPDGCDRIDELRNL